jgi:hypothetical protein
MKKIRIFLSIVAVVFAFGGAVASRLIDQNPVYQFIDNPGTENDRCDVVSLECQTSSTMYPCRTIVGGPILRQSSITSCGNDLWRTTAPPSN